MDKQTCQENGGKWDSAREVCSVDSRGTDNISQSTPQINLGSQDKSPGIAAVLSFIWPGAGQVYNGQLLKGFFMAALVGFLAFTVFAGVGLVLLPIIYLFQVYDAYRTAKKINRK